MVRFDLPWPNHSIVLDPPFADLGAIGQPVALVGVALVPVVLILWLLRNELRLVSRGTAFALLLLRLALLSVVLGLVCLQPRMVAESRREEPGRIAVLVDRSASMDLADTGQAESRSQIQRRILDKSGLDLLGRLASRHRVELFGFHRQTWTTDPRELASLFIPPEGAGVGDVLFTDLRQALERANQSTGTRDLLGVIVLTDGQHNHGDSPISLVKDWQDRLPIYPVAIGSRKPPSDVAIIAVQAPTRSLKDEEVSVRVSLRVTGQAVGDLAISLHLDDPAGPPVQQRTIAHDGKKRDYDETFSVKLGQVGTKRLIAKVAPSQEDARPDNNTATTEILVTDDKARVLLVDGEMRWESHYLATALARDPKIRLKKVIFEQPRLDTNLTSEKMDALGLPRLQLPEGIDALGEYQCIILGDVTPEQLPLADRKRLEKFVAERGGTLVVVAGKNAMPLGFPAMTSGEPDPLAKLLPIESARVASIKDGFGIARTAAGLEHRFLEMEPDAKDNDERWASFPPSYWAVVGKPKPGASVLGTIAKPDFEKDQGLIVLQNFGLGRVLFVGIDSTWRWRFKTGDTYHHRFWGQAIRWAIAEETLGTGNRYVRLGTQRPTYTRGQNVEIVVRWEEEAGAIRAGSPMAARIVRKLGEGKEEVVATVSLGAKPGQPRAFGGEVRDLAEGSYEVEVVAPELDAKMLLPEPEPGKVALPGPLRSPFQVKATTSREYLDLEVNEDLLQALAKATDGRVVTPETVEELIDELQNRRIVHIDPPRDHPLYLGWWPLALVLCLLAGEWIVRKNAGLP